MFSNRLLLIVLGGEAVLALLGFLWIRIRNLPFETGSPVFGLILGMVAAGAFGLVNLYLLRGAPAVAGVRSIRRLYYDVLRPLFVGLGPFEVIPVGLAAGLGEEVLFRGAIQPELGIVPASLLFGAAHVDRSENLMFGCWAAIFGLILGWLAIVTGGLLAPVVAHAVYDTSALTYIIRLTAGERIIPLALIYRQRETKPKIASRRKVLNS